MSESGRLRQGAQATRKTPLRANVSCVPGTDELVAVGDGGLLLSSDGMTWTTRASPTDQELFAITFGNRGFVAVAGVDVIAVSADGLEWTAVRVSD